MGTILITLFSLAGAALVTFLVRMWLKFTSRKFISDIRMDGKTVLITGSNGGIGKEAAKEIAKRGARIIMACRNMKKGFEARDEIIKECGHQNVIVHHLDLSSLSSIRKFAAVINKTESKIDVLILNAGLSCFSKQVTEDGLEMTMATNHYGSFLLTHLLIDLLKKAESARIVVTASKTHTLSNLNPTRKEDLNPVNALFPMNLYGNSKFANILFTFELARRLKSSNITTNCLHPGVIDSGIWESWPFPLSLGIKLYRLTLRTVEEGSQTILYCALSPELEGVTGKYFRNCNEGTPHKDVHNTTWQSALWEGSKKLVNLTENDPQI